MKHSATRALFEYWNELRGDRAAPKRSEIEPAAIRNILADTFMLEVDAAKRLPFRLAGTRVNGLFDGEQKGRSFLELWKEEERRNIAAILLTVADAACPVVAGGVVDTWHEGECAIEALFLPLRHYGRTHARILGLLKAASQPGWHGILPLGPISLRSLRMIDKEEREIRRPMKRMVIGQQVVTPFVTEKLVAPARLQLRVIQGGLYRR